MSTARPYEVRHIQGPGGEPYGAVVSRHATLAAAVRAMPRSGQPVTLVIVAADGTRRFPTEVEMAQIEAWFAQRPPRR